MKFEIKSEKKYDRIQDGFFQMSGQINVFVGDSTCRDVIVTNADQSVTFEPNEDGLFRAQFPISDSIVYFYKPGSGEVVGKLPKDRNKKHFEVVVTMLEPVYIVFKPVIYLYDVEDLELSVKPGGTMTFTYPVLEGNWHIEADEKGTLTDLHSNKKYPYLFWEAEMRSLDFMSANKGNHYNYYSHVNSSEIVDFLEFELESAGLNSKERTDFITFWGPRIQQYETVDIQFLIDEDYERIGKLEHELEEFSQRRIYLLFRESNKSPINTANVPVLWNSFDRSGSTLVEWGGTDLTKPKNL